MAGRHVRVRGTAGRLPWLFALVIPLVLPFAACSGDGTLTAEGVILEVNASSLTEVESFTLRNNEGVTLVFEVAPDADDDPQEGFIASHLRSHAVLAEQVRITYREQDGVLLATKLEHR